MQGKSVPTQDREGNDYSSMYEVNKSHDHANGVVIVGQLRLPVVTTYKLRIETRTPRPHKRCCKGPCSYGHGLVFFADQMRPVKNDGVTVHGLFVVTFASGIRITSIEWLGVGAQPYVAISD